MRRERERRQLKEVLLRLLLPPQKCRTKDLALIEQARKLRTLLLVSVSVCVCVLLLLLPLHQTLFTQDEMMEEDVSHTGEENENSASASVVNLYIYRDGEIRLMMMKKWWWWWWLEEWGEALAGLTVEQSRKNKRRRWWPYCVDG